MDYTTLVAAADVPGSIKYAINYSRIDSEGILAEAQAWIYQRVRLSLMIATADVSIALAASTATKPERFLDPIHFSIPGYVPRIALREPDQFRTDLARLLADETLPEGPPTYWANINGIHFNTASDLAYTAKMVFYQRPEYLADDNETNWLTDRYPSLLRRTCLMLAAEARKEWDTMSQSELRALADIEEIKKEDELNMRGLELDFNWEANS